ncbi:MAG: histidine--tRNA ligase [Desulfuromonadia bacterium]
MSLTAIKGFNDILPGEVEIWQRIEETARRVFSLHGFSEIRIPILEKTELFARSIGDATDIVEKEMYSFVDKGGNRATLRPEGTAGVMRAFIEHKLHALDSVTKLYYLGPMFRYERPQKGRYRQFHQIGAEVIGVADPMVDAQLLVMLTQFFAALGLDEPRLMINSLGCPDCRPSYRETLVSYLSSRTHLLCEDCRRRIGTNPLRALDCKVEGCREATVDAPAMLDHLCSPCASHFDRVQRYLHLSGTPHRVDRRMVRGLDYYTRTTFELVTSLLGAQSAVAAGGRYDRLIADLGGPALPGIGFALGVERVALLLSGMSGRVDPPRLFIAAIGEEPRRRGFALMTELQRRGVSVAVDYEGKSLKSQMRRADRFGSPFVLIVGDRELEQGEGVLKRMENGEQRSIQLSVETLVDAIS